MYRRNYLRRFGGNVKNIKIFKGKVIVYGYDEDFYGMIGGGMSRDIWAMTIFMLFMLFDYCI